MPAVIWSMLVPLGCAVDDGDGDEEELALWRRAGGGYRAKKRESRGGRVSASLIYCREAMIVCV